MTAAPRRIAVVTSSRADYGHLVWPLRELAARPGVELRLIAFGSHLSPTWGGHHRGDRAGWLRGRPPRGVPPLERS
ncbi:MAG: hypothetical protein ACYTGJ_13900 [Planctomycetota bacterium]